MNLASIVEGTLVQSQLVVE